MEKITRWLVISMSVFLYPNICHAIEPSSQPLDIGRNLMVERAQASTITNESSHQTSNTRKNTTTEAIQKRPTTQNISTKSKAKNTLDPRANEKEMTLQYIRGELWAGNYSAGEKGLATYKTMFGEDKNYLTEKARLLALTNQSKAALALLEPLLKKDSKSSTLLDIRNYALQHPETSEQQPTSVASSPPPQLIDESQKTDEKNKEAILTSARQYLLTGNYPAGEKELAIYKEKFSEKDEGYLIEKARLLALTNKPKEALTLAESLLKKDPKNQTLLDIKNYALQHPETPAKQPTLTKNPDVETLSSNKNITDQTNPLLKLAESQAQKAEFKKSAETYRQYLQNNPDDKTTTLTYIRTELWAANYSIAEEALTKYKLKFGADENYLTEKVRLLALTNQSKAALALLEPLLKKDPQNKFLLDIKNYALKHPDPVINKMLPSSVNIKMPSSTAPIEKKENVLLKQARAYSAKSELTAAATTYSRYLCLYPFDQTAWIEYAYVASWAGNSRKALAILEQYCQLFGETLPYLKTKGLILAQAARPRASCKIITPLLIERPNDSELNQARITALYYYNQPIPMFCNLAKFQELTNNNSIAKDLTEFVTTPYRTNVNLDIFYSTDTDTVGIDHETLNGQIFITPLTQLLFLAKEEQLSADMNSGLEPIQGGNGLTISEQTIGINRRINCALALEGSIGNAYVSKKLDAFVYNFAANLNPADTLFINLLEKRNYYDVSARVVSLNIKQQLNQVTINWEPIPQNYFSLQTSYSTFTDSNTMWYTIFSPKLGVLRNEKLNLDVGLSAILFGFSKKLNHGYYDPKLYEYYAVTANGYWKQSNNIGYGFSIGLGQQKDETFASYKFGGDLAVKGYFGIYKDWMLVLSAGASNRGRNIADNARRKGSYEIWALDATITKRF